VATSSSASRANPRSLTTLARLSPLDNVLDQTTALPIESRTTSRVRDEARFRLQRAIVGLLNSCRCSTRDVRVGLHRLSSPSADEVAPLYRVVSIHIGVYSRAGRRFTFTIWGSAHVYQSRASN